MHGGTGEAVAWSESQVRLRISANVTGDFGNVTDLRLGAGLRA